MSKPEKEEVEPKRRAVQLLGETLCAPKKSLKVVGQVSP
jgi:hypothetical protein